MPRPRHFVMSPNLLPPLVNHLRCVTHRQTQRASPPFKQITTSPQSHQHLMAELARGSLRRARFLRHLLPRVRITLDLGRRLVPLLRLSRKLEVVEDLQKGELLPPSRILPTLAKVAADRLLMPQQTPEVEVMLLISRTIHEPHRHRGQILEVLPLLSHLREKRRRQDSTREILLSHRHAARHHHAGHHLELHHPEVHHLHAGHHLLCPQRETKDLRTYKILCQVTTTFRILTLTLLKS